MNTITFQATYEDGLIRVPEAFRNNIEREVRVTVENLAKRKKVKFEAVRIKTKDFKFNREEANER